MEQGIAVRARGYNREPSRSWERGEVFLVTPEDLAQHAAGLYVMKPEEVEAYLATHPPLVLLGGTAPKPAQEAAQAASSEAQAAAGADDTGEDAEALDADARDLGGPEFDRSMEGRAGVRRRRG